VVVGAAAEALANTVTKEDLARKQLYPAFPQIRDISAQVATAVAEVAYEKGKFGLILSIFKVLKISVLKIDSRLS